MELQRPVARRQRSRLEMQRPTWRFTALCRAPIEMFVSRCTRRDAQIAAAHAGRGVLFNNCKSALMRKSLRHMPVVYCHRDIGVRLNERRWNLNPSWNSGMTSFSFLLKQRAAINEKMIARGTCCASSAWWQRSTRMRDEHIFRPSSLVELLLTWL